MQGSEPRKVELEWKKEEEWQSKGIVHVEGEKRRRKKWLRFLGWVSGIMVMPLRGKGTWEEEWLWEDLEFSF